MRLSFVVPFVAAGLVLQGGVQAFAQNSTPVVVNAPLVHLAPADAQTMAVALRSISQQAGVAFVAEGKPFRVRNSAPPLAPIVAKWPAQGVLLGEAVTTVADAYDYETERKGNVFLLRKRYTNPEDLPDVTAEELRLSLRDVVRAASGLPAPVADMPSFEDRNSPFTSKFYQTLTPPQIKRLAGKDGQSEFVNVSELNPAQKQMMWDLAISRHIQHAIGEAQRAQAAIRLCDQKTTTFGWFDMQTSPNFVPTVAATRLEIQTVSMLCCMVRENSKDALVPFAPDGRMRFRFANRRIGYRTPKEETDHAAPTSADYGPNHEPLPPPEETGDDSFTLKTLGETLRSKAIASQVGIGIPTFSPQEALAAKSVTVVGSDGRNGEAIWRAVGAVYGLHVVRAEQNGPLLLMRPRAQVARDLNGLNAAAFASFPAPLIRLYRGALKAAETDWTAHYSSDLQIPDGTSDGVKAEFKRMRAEQAHTMATFHTPDQLKQAALHRFRVLLEPLLAQSQDRRVLYDRLGAKAHDLWTLVLFVDCLGDASGLEDQTLPATITDFDEGYLSSHINDGFGTTEPMLQFTFWSRNDKGYSKAEGGSVFPVPDTYPKPTKPAK